MTGIQNEFKYIKAGIPGGIMTETTATEQPTVVCGDEDMVVQGDEDMRRRAATSYSWIHHMVRLEWTDVDQHELLLIYKQVQKLADVGVNSAPTPDGTEAPFEPVVLKYVLDATKLSVPIDDIGDVSVSDVIDTVQNWFLQVKDWYVDDVVNGFLNGVLAAGATASAAFKAVDDIVAKNQLLEKKVAELEAATASPAQDLKEFADELLSEGESVSEKAGLDMESILDEVEEAAAETAKVASGTSASSGGGGGSSSTGMSGWAIAGLAIAGAVAAYYGYNHFFGEGEEEDVVVVDLDNTL